MVAAWLIGLSAGLAPLAAAAAGSTPPAASPLNEPSAVAAADEAPLPLVWDASLSLRFTARGREPQTSLLLDEETFAWETGGLLLPRARQLYPSAVLGLGGEWEPWRWLSLRALVDSGELRSGRSLEPPLGNRVTTEGSPIGPWLASGAFVRELAVTLRFGRFAADLGRRFEEIVGGLVFADFATGVSLSWQSGGEFSGSRAELLALAVGHTFAELERPSPLVALRYGRELSLFETIDVTLAFFADRNDVLRDVIESAVAERVVGQQQGLDEQARLDEVFLIDRPSTGQLVYLGVDGNLIPANGLSLRAALVAQLGTVRAEGLWREYRFTTTAVAATVDGSYALGERFALGATLLALSGDDPPQIGLFRQRYSYHGFLAVAPYWTWTGLFFCGGVNQGLYPGRASAPGVNGHGVIGGVVRGEWSGDALRATLVAAPLWSPTGPPPGDLGGNGSFYGIESDAILDWRLGEHLGLALEGDLFWPQSFFAQHTMAYRVLAQVWVRVGD